MHEKERGFDMGKQKIKSRISSALIIICMCLSIFYNVNVVVCAGEDTDGVCEIGTSVSIDVCASDNSIIDRGETVNASNVNLKVSGLFDYENAYDVLEIVNEERAAEGLPQIVMDKDLMDAAMLRAAELSVAYYGNHNRPNGEEWSTVSNKSHGENIAAGYHNALNVMNAWMESSGHRGNILREGITSIGVGCFTNNGVTFFVQEFGYDTPVKCTQPANTTKTVSISVAEKSMETANIYFSSSKYVASKTYTGTAKVYMKNLGNASYACWIAPENFDWTVGDPWIATIEGGIITAHSTGSTGLVAEMKITPYVRLGTNITTSGFPVAVTSVAVYPGSESLVIGERETCFLDFMVFPDNADDRTVTWSSSDTSVATVNASGKVVAMGVGQATITATSNSNTSKKDTCVVTVTKSEDISDSEDSDTDEETELIQQLPEVGVHYRTHIQTYGWEGTKELLWSWKSNGAMSGTSGKAKRLEGINVVVNSVDPSIDLDLGIQYTTHCQSYGWLPWSANGEMNGTEGEAKRLEAIKIQLTGAHAQFYDVYYRVHAQSYGWLGWAKNGAPAGTAGYAKRLEGIQVIVVKKGDSFNQNIGNITSAKTESFVAKEGSSPIVNHKPTSNTNPVIPGAEEVNVAYRTHVQSYGWQAWKYNGQMSGTSGQAKRLEGINIELRNKDCSGDIVYTTHVQSYGWQGSETDQSKWFKNGQLAGTSGEAKRLEAICINLTGEMGQKYDIYYRVHAQSYGWLGWAKNGAPAGTAGYGKRLEGIQIVLVPKGGAAPGNHQGVVSVNASPYVAK